MPNQDKATAAAKNNIAVSKAHIGGKNFRHEAPTTANANAVRTYARNVRSFAKMVRSIASSSRKIISCALKRA